MSSGSRLAKAKKDVEGANVRMANHIYGKNVERVENKLFG